MKIKGWKSTKYKSEAHSIWMNTAPEHEAFGNNYYVSVGRVGSTEDYYMAVVKEGKQISVNIYPKFEDARSAAFKYMKQHPKG